MSVARELLDRARGGELDLDSLRRRPDVSEDELWNGWAELARSPLVGLRGPITITAGGRRTTARLSNSAALVRSILPLLLGVSDPVAYVAPLESVLSAGLLARELKALPDPQRGPKTLELLARGTCDAFLAACFEILARPAPVPPAGFESTDSLRVEDSADGLVLRHADVHGLRVVVGATPSRPARVQAEEALGGPRTG